jgi:hypothetical protein
MSTVGAPTFERLLPDLKIYTICIGIAIHRLFIFNSLLFHNLHVSYLFRTEETGGL